MCICVEPILIKDIKDGHSALLPVVPLSPLRLKGRYPLIRFDMADSGKQRPSFDNLYIDFNALVYQCIRVPLPSPRKAAASSRTK
jgi:hypothetical protein